MKDNLKKANDSLTKKFYDCEHPFLVITQKLNFINHVLFGTDANYKRPLLIINEENNETFFFHSLEFSPSMQECLKHIIVAKQLCLDYVSEFKQQKVEEPIILVHEKKYEKDSIFEEIHTNEIIIFSDDRVLMLNSIIDILKKIVDSISKLTSIAFVDLNLAKNDFKSHNYIMTIHSQIILAIVHLNIEVKKAMADK